MEFSVARVPANVVRSEPLPPDPDHHQNLAIAHPCVPTPTSTHIWGQPAGSLNTLSNQSQPVTNQSLVSIPTQ
jgi:hypothetical protein